MRYVKLLKLVGLLLVIAGLSSPVQSQLVPGDIAIIAHNFDDPDQIVFVCMKDLPAGTQILFTDKAWKGTSFASTEGTYTWTAPSLLAKGSTVSLLTTGMSLSTSGDQVFAFQGTLANPSFIFGLSTKPWLTSGLTGSATSYLPTSLTNGLTAVAFTTERDNGYFNQVSNSGNPSVILSAICNRTNWTVADTRYGSFPAWTFSLNNLATEPGSQPTGLIFADLRTYRCNVAYTAPLVAPAGYLVTRRTGALPTGVPTDGASYQVGDAVGDARVAYVGSSLSFLQEGLIAGQTVGYRVFAYNGSGITTNYRQQAPLEGIATLPASGMGNYYGTLSAADPSFVTQLQARISSPHTKVAYDQYDETMMTHFAFVDTTAGQRVATCVYSGERYVYTAPFVWYTASPFSREHTFCHSWMPTYPTTGGNEYADQHHLFPVNQTNANVTRSNHPLGVVQTVTSTYLDAKYGLDNLGNLVYEPRDAQKGDAARAILYMCSRYHGESGLDWSLSLLNTVTLPALAEDPQDLQILRQWNAMDPVDAYEIARNDYVQSIQQNRNPFVDHPEWVSYIDFLTMTWLSTPAKQAPQMELMLSVWPNPMSTEGILSIASPSETSANVLVIDQFGRILRKSELQLLVGINEIDLEPHMLAQGAYAIVVQTGASRFVKKIIVQ